MIDRSRDLLLQIQDVAEQATLKYVRGILTVEELKAQLLHEWQMRGIEEIHLRNSILTRLAQGLCSRTLCTAWRSQQTELRNRAFDNIRRYLENGLRHSGYATTLQQYAGSIDDILNQTLLEFHVSLERNPMVGPRDPTTFIKWTQVAAFRHAHDFIHKLRESSETSLEEGEVEFADQFIDERNQNPEDEVIARQLQQALKDVILSLRNPLYQQVLLSTFLEGVEEKELAARLKLSVQEIYQCRFRAVRALRKHPDIQRILRIWRGEE